MLTVGLLVIQQNPFKRHPQSQKTSLGTILTDHATLTMVRTMACRSPPCPTRKSFDRGPKTYITRTL